MTVGRLGTPSATENLALAAPIDLPNIDTDRIIPARFLRKPRGAPGYASFLFSVDLEAQTVTAPDGALHRFEIDPFRKEMLLTGRDEIGLTEGFEAQIREFEARQRARTPWAIPPR